MATPVIPVEDLIVVLSDGRVVAAQPVYVVPDSDPVQDAAGRWVQPTAIYFSGGAAPSQSLTLSNNSIAENSPPDTLIGAFTVGGEVDGWAFVISLNDPTIKLITNELYTTDIPLDYESTPEPEFRVTATQSDPYISITRQFTLNVTDIVEIPALTALTFTSVGPFALDVAPGTELTEIGNLEDADNIEIVPDDGTVVLNAEKTHILKGLEPWTSGARSYEVVKYLTGAPNSPISTTWEIEVNSGLVPVEIVSSPVISGSAVQNQTLTATPGTYSGGTGTLTALGQWYRDDNPIDLAVDLTYKLSSADIGATEITYREVVTDDEGSAVIGTSNVIGPIVALVTDITYSFDGANNIPLSTLGWDRVVGSEALFTDGAGLLKKSTTADANTVYLGAGSGAKTQRLTIYDMAASNVLYMGIMGKVVGGAVDGYILRKSSATNLRLHRYNAGTATNITLGIDVTGVTSISLEAIVGDLATVLNVYADSNPVPIYTFSDNTTARKTSGRAIIYTYAVGQQPTLASSMVFHASNYVGGTGVFNSVAVPFGRATPANLGSMNISKQSLGVLASGEVGDWALVKTAGGAKWPTDVVGGVTPAPVTALDDTDAGQTITYAIWADGKDTTKTFTIDIQSSSGPAAITIANPSNIATLKAIHSTLGGKLLEFLEGCADNFGDYANQPATFSGWKLHTGVITIRSNPDGTKTIPAMLITDSTRLDVIGVRISNYLPPWPDMSINEYHPTLNPGGTGSRGNTQNRPLLSISSESGVASYINVRRCKIGAPVSMQSSPERWYTGLAVSGSTTTLANKNHHIVIGADKDDPEVWVPDPLNLSADQPLLANGNIMRRVKDGYVGGNVNFITVRGNIVRDFCSNASFWGGMEVSDFDMWDFLHVDGWYNPSDAYDHPDTLQFGSTAVAHDYERIIVRRGIILVINADKHSQGPFFNDTTFNSNPANAGPKIKNSNQYLTGFLTRDCEMSNIAFNVGSTPAFLTDLGTGWVVHNISLVRGEGAGLGLDPSRPAKYVDPQILGANVQDINDVWHYSSGVASHLAAHSYSDIAQGMAVTNSVSYNTVKGGGTGLSGPPGQNETVRAAYYATFYEAPSDPNQFERFRPKLNGALKNPDGSYAGCFAPNMAWGTTSVYVP